MGKLIDKDALEAFRARAFESAYQSGQPAAVPKMMIFISKVAKHKTLIMIMYFPVVVEYMKKISEMTGRTYAPFVYYGAPDADRIIIAMGSVTETASEVIDCLE